MRDVQDSAPRWFREAIAVRPEDCEVTVEGCRIHYLRWGEAGNPGLVFIHGGADSCAAAVGAVVAACAETVADEATGGCGVSSTEGLRCNSTTTSTPMATRPPAHSNGLANGFMGGLRPAWLAASGW